MPIVIATGTNLGDRLHNLKLGLEELKKHFELLEASRIYESSAVDYTDQPDFYNQVLVFKTPGSSPEKTMELLLSIEKNLGRNRDIPKGPRIIDIDLLFYDFEKRNSNLLELPHPRLFERSFVVLPLKELEYFKTLEKQFVFKSYFENTANPIRE